MSEQKNKTKSQYFGPLQMKGLNKLGNAYIPGDEDLSFYRQGDFIDMCRGPHVPDTGKLKAFKLDIYVVFH